VDPFLPYIYATMIGSVIAVVGWVANRKAGLGPIQAESRRLLEGNNRMLSDRIDLLEEQLKHEKSLRSRLATRVIRLERTVVTLSEENDYLRTRSGLPKRSRTTIEIDPENDEELLEDGGT
jgi:hypothetical protein